MRKLEERFLGKIILMGILVLFSATVLSQDRMVELEKRLIKYSRDIPVLKEEVDISVNGVSIQELLRGIASNVDLNLTVDPSIDVKVVNNFTQVRVMDILLYLCKQYNLDLNRTGNIISVLNYQGKVKQEPKAVKKELDIRYDKTNDLLSVDLNKDTLVNVIKKIVDLSDRNIIISADHNNQKVTGYLKNAPFLDGMVSFCYSNNLSFSETENGFYLIDAKSSAISTKQEDQSLKRTPYHERNTRLPKGSEEAFNVISADSITIFADKLPIVQILTEVTGNTNVDYLLLSDIQGETSLNLKNVSFEKFLTYLLQGTSYTYKKNNGVYLIGDRSLEDLKCAKVVQLKYRTISNIKELIPAELTQNVSAHEFVEQNSILLTGAAVDIENVEAFIKEIDKIVPVVLIEVMIIDHSKNNSIQTGIKAGFGEEANSMKSTGTFSPGIDVNVGTGSINQLLSSINGWGWFNLGKVTPNFYLNVQALEDNNVIKIRSTPKLATLNGHEASLVSGETRYYREEQNSYYGSQIPQLEKAYSWKAINADLKIDIRPIVSGNDQVTLEIEVNQSQFTPREYEQAPPGSVTRTFKSLIRVKNNEMILLGGLDRNTTSSTSQGLPVLARIPVLKWIFGSRSKSKENAKLSLFIKPTIIY